MKAFLIIERHSIRFYRERPNTAEGPRISPEIKGVLCVAFEESAQKVAEIVGGKYDQIEFDDMLRPIIRLPQELFSPYSEKILQYKKGPIHLYIGEESAGTYLFIVEVPLLQSSQVTV